MPKVNDSSRGSSDLVASPSGPVVRLPAGSDWNKMDVKMFLRKTLKASYIPLCVCGFILEYLHVIKQVPPSVSRILDNCRFWTSRVNTNEPILCGCAAFQWLSRRHAHVHCPGWDYAGLYVDTANAKTTTEVLSGWRQHDMKMAVHG